MNRSNLQIASLLLIAAAASASAQDVPFSTYRHGAMAPSLAETGQRVIRTQAELRQAGLERLVPAGETFDFSSQSLVALVLPYQSNGGVSISVDSIERRTLGGTELLEVKYLLRRPAPGLAATKVVTRPFAVYTIAATRLHAAFLDADRQGPGDIGVLPAPSPSPSGSSFRVVNQGSQASSNIPGGNRLVKSAAELASSGLSSLVPDPSSIKWGVEQLAFLVAPRRLRGGLALAVKQIVPLGSGLSAQRSEIQYELSSTTEGGPSVTPSSRPFQVIRFPRGEATFKQLDSAATTFSGILKVEAGRGGSGYTVTIQRGNESLRITPPSFAESLISLGGERVTIEATPRPRHPNVLTARRLISPQPFRGAGVIGGSRGAPTLTSKKGTSLRLAGSLAPSLGEGARGRKIRGIKGYCFRSERRLVVTQYQIKAHQAADVVVNGKRVGSLESGETVTVLGSSGSASSIVVKPGKGPQGEVELWHLGLDTNPVPFAPGPPSTGAAGALSGE